MRLSQECPTKPEYITTSDTGHGNNEIIIFELCFLCYITKQHVSIEPCAARDPTKDDAN